MKRIAFVVFLSASLALAAQTAPKPATSTAASTAKPSTTSTAAHPATADTYKLPPGEKRSPALRKTPFITWKYQDLVVGTGPEAESGKIWHVKYKGWRAADGVVFDSSEDHKRPVIGKDGKPEMEADGKTPKMGEAEPLSFPQGQGRVIPGFDDGLYGMRVGGKRRIFIPWQMAYGTRNIPDRPDHPGIPAKSDLIFDVELVDVTDMPAPPQRPTMPQRPMPGAPGAPGAPGRPATPPPAGQPATPNPSGAPATAPAPGTTPPAGTPTPQPAAPANPNTQPQSKPATPQPAPQPSTPQSQPSTPQQ